MFQVNLARRRPSSLLSKHTMQLYCENDIIYLKLNITAAPFHDIICRISNHKIGACLLTEAEAMRVTTAALICKQNA